MPRCKTCGLIFAVYNEPDSTYCSKKCEIKDTVQKVANETIKQVRKDLELPTLK